MTVRSALSRDFTARCPSVRLDLGRFAAAIVAVVCVASPSQAIAQTSIGGIVLEAGTTQPIAGAQVSISGSGLGSLTQANGRFLIVDVPAGSLTVEVSLLGYRSASRVAAGGTVDLEFFLERRPLELDAIVVTGTVGEQRTRTLGTTVGTIEVDRIAQVSASGTVESVLSGPVPGLSVAFGSGEVGTGANIRMRGAGSLSLSSQPLLYVDGVRVNGDPADDGGGRNGVGIDGGVPPSRLNDINPEDIESIEVIKGPAASTLYGTEASNGVINIITKRGHRGDAQFTLTVKQGANWIPDPETYFPETYYRCRGTSETCTVGEITPFNVLREDRVRNGNVWFQTGHRQGYAGSVSGGSESVRYYFSGDWDRDEGVLDYNWQNQTRGRANLNWTPRDDFDVTLGMSGVRSRLRSGSANQPISFAILFSCAFGCEEGSGAPGAVDGSRRGYTGYLPEVLADSVEGYQSVSRTTFSLVGTHRPFGWFTQRLVWGADWTETNNSELYRPISGPGHGAPQGQKTIQRQTAQFLSLDYSATARFEVSSQLELATSVGAQYYQKQFDWVYAQGRDFAATTLETVGAGAVQEADEGLVENKTLGAFIQEQLSWNDRIYLTAALRGDDNSAFGANYDFVLYPKFSLSWVAFEDGSTNRSWLDNLRVRAAWGQAGQQPDVFAALRTYQPTVGPGASPTLLPENIGNPDLEPEVGSELEVGFDATLFDERLAIELTAYDQKRTNALIPVPVQPSLGFTGVQFRNLGEIANGGVELRVQADLLRGDDIALNLQVAAAHNRNEVVSLGGLPAQVLGANVGLHAVEGFPLGAVFLPNVVSADIQGSGPAAGAVNVLCEGGTVLPNTVNLSRGGRDPVACGQAPLIYQGSSIPTRDLSAAGTLTLFGNIQLHAQVDYKGGHTRIDGNAVNAHFFRVSRAGQERNDAELLGLGVLGPQGAFRVGVYDASFAKLRRIAATWTVPSQVASRLGADGLTVTLSAHNLWTLWQATDTIFGYPVLDPEQSDTNNIFGPGGLGPYSQDGWPPIKRVQVSARVTF